MVLVSVFVLGIQGCLEPGLLRASSGPGVINNMGPCVRVAAQGQEGATANANHFKTLMKHWYSIMFYKKY